MNKTRFAKFAALMLMVVITTSVSAQRFDATLWGGVSACQIDGDDAGRYNHFRLHGAVNTTFSLSSNEDAPLKMLVELGFAQKGSYINSINRSINLQYVEIPVMLCFGPREGLRIGAGVAPGILVRANVMDGYELFGNKGEENTALEANFRKMDRLPIVAELAYRKNHLIIALRYENSMLSVVKEASHGTYRIFRSNMGNFNRLLTLGAGYNF